jgi:hypothetical protein
MLLDMLLTMPVRAGNTADSAITPERSVCDSIRAEPVHTINSMMISQGS